MVTQISIKAFSLWELLWEMGFYFKQQGTVEFLVSDVLLTSVHKQTKTFSTRNKLLAGTFRFTSFQKGGGV